MHVDISMFIYTHMIYVYMYGHTNADIHRHTCIPTLQYHTVRSNTIQYKRIQYKTLHTLHYTTFHCIALHYMNTYIGVCVGSYRYTHSLSKLHAPAPAGFLFRNLILWSLKLNPSTRTQPVVRVSQPSALQLRLDGGRSAVHGLPEQAWSS